jgi:hypothetical protein
MPPRKPSANARVVSFPGSRLTQGSIFSCAIAEQYEACSTYGLIITARCDAEQDKVRAYNYLPIVTLKDWLVRDGSKILAERLRAESSSHMKSCLLESGYSPQILETEPPIKVGERLFQGGDKKADKAKTRFLQLCDTHELAMKGLTAVPSQELCLRLAEAVPKTKDSLIKELVHHKLSGYYFFDRIEPNGADNGFVVLLREVHALARPVALLLVEGINSTQYKELCEKDHASARALSITGEDLAMPIAVVCSPYVEHLMQSFSILFGRIGLPDPEPAYITQLWDRQGLAGEEKK